MSISEYKNLLLLFCSIGDIQLLEYMLRQPGISDPPIEDGTTAYSVALGKNDPHMVRLLLGEIWNETYRQLTIDAILEIERRGCLQEDEDMKRVLKCALDDHQVPECIMNYSSLESDDL